MSVQLVHVTAHHRVDFSFHAPVHLLAAYGPCVRREGESFVQGASRSKLRDVTKKLTFVPAGHEYREWYNSRAPADVTYLFFNLPELPENFADITFAPRLFFEDAAIWSIVEKVRQAVEIPRGPNRLYVEALGVVLIHELASFNRRRCGPEALRGGLAGWQQRIVAKYIEEHLSDQIPLATLARLARLSTFHFCRAFKQSFGTSPHRYHTNKRIERAKFLLAKRQDSVTRVGQTVGFGETSSFIAVFRKVTGQTPSRYQRALG